METTYKSSHTAAYHPHLKYRPPTPPNSFRSSSGTLWRSHNIHLGPHSDSDATQTKENGNLSKSSESDGQSSPRTSVQPDELSTDCKSTQVDCVLSESSGLRNNTERAVRSPAYERGSPCRLSDCSNHSGQNARKDYPKFRDRAQRCKTPVIHEGSCDGYLPCCAAHQTSDSSSKRCHRQAVSRSLVLENQFSCPRSSPLPIECSGTYRKMSFRNNDGLYCALSDSNVCRRRRSKCPGPRMDKCSDSSTSSISNASYRAVRKKSRTTNRVRASSNLLSVPGYCAACSGVPPYYFQPDPYRLPPSHSGDTNGLQKIRQLESEKKNLVLQISVLSDQIEAQADKIRELESLLEEKKELLRQTEQNLHQEMMTRSAIENSKLEMMTEISSLRLRLTASERDRKDSDERYRKIQNELQDMYDRYSAVDINSDRTVYRVKTLQNGATHLHSEKNSDVEKLNAALEAVIASNDEKDKKIEDLRLALIKYKKLQDYVLSGHQRKASDVSVKDGQSCDAETSKDLIPPPSPGNEGVRSQTHIKVSGKPPSGYRAPFTSISPVIRTSAQAKESIPSLDSHSTANSDCKSLPSLQSLHKSSSLENVRSASQQPSPQKNSYGTIPRQSGSQALQNLQEKLQTFECSATLPASGIGSLDPCQSPTPSTASRKNLLNEKGKETTRGSRNKSSGVSFGKGFFKLRSGKRSSSAPELAPFESVTIPFEERQVSSASPTPQPTMQPFFIKPEKERNRGLLKIFTKWKRSGSQNIEKIEGDFRRGTSARATAGPRLGWSRDVVLDPDIPFSSWSNDYISEWFHKIGLSMYMCDCRRWKCNGEQLLNASASEVEKELNIKNPLHKKKLLLNLQRYKSDALPAAINSMDYHWVVRWLDDIGLPQYKDAFTEARVDGRVLHYLTVEDLLNLKVTNQLHHISIKRGIQILREKNFDPHCLVRRSVPDEDKNYRPESVALWTNHRVMEWLRTVDLSEYAPNLRGSGVHGALIVYEPKFNTDLFATLLNIAPNKTLLRRHLATHFKAIVGSDFIQAKRDLETDQLYTPLTPNIKIKNIRKAQFVLKKRKSKGDSETEEFVCPMDIPVGALPPCVNGEKLIVRRNSDPTHPERGLLSDKERDEKATAEIGSVSKEITSLTDMLHGEKLLKNAPTTNV